MFSSGIARAQAGYSTGTTVVVEVVVGVDVVDVVVVVAAKAHRPVLL